MKTNVLMNPPFSAEWEPFEDERFAKWGIAPKSKADFAFLLHGYSNLSTNGTMAIVLPHGVLFRGNVEGKIRKKILMEGAIDAVIGLPGKLFAGTDIPTAILILKKNRVAKDVLFIDASNDFEKGKSQNFLNEEHKQKIFDTYTKRKNIEKYAHVASFSEIEENDFNLNIPRYVDTFEEEEVESLSDIAKELKDINKQIAESEEELCAMMQELVGATPETQKELDDFLNLFK